MKAAHVVIIGNQADTMIRFRGTLIQTLIRGGARVTAVCPAGNADEQRMLAELGVSHVPVKRLSRGGMNPFADAMLVGELVGILRRARPSHVLSYFLKPAIYGTLAARLVGVPRRVAMIEGLGYAFSRDPNQGASARRSAARWLLSGLLRVTTQAANKILVLNRDDETFLVEQCGVRLSEVVRLDGIGVDMDEYAEQPVTAAVPTFCLAARLIREKGVADFVKAARLVRRQDASARFVLLGDVDETPNSITRTEVEGWVEEGLIEWPGKVADVRPWLARSSVFVLPSFYGEGLPRSIMEAMAAGRPVITTTVPGCRDSVTPGVSGFLVEPGDVEGLARAMIRFVEDGSLACSMGAAAAAEARRRYDRLQSDSILADHLMARSSNRSVDAFSPFQN